MRIAVIPARGGSKRIPRKNIRDFNGRPIIAWSIEAAHESGLFDNVIVSTDDDEIAEKARAWGAEIPFLRPNALADDFTGTSSVIAHAVRWYLHNVGPLEQICCIYPTAPLMLSVDLVSGLRILLDSGADFSVAVTAYEFPIQRALRTSSTGRLEMLWPSEYSTRSQDLERVWHDAGQFYWGQTQAWLDQIPLLGPHSVPVPLPSARVQDIDTIEDWTRAEILSQLLRRRPEI